MTTEVVIGFFGALLFAWRAHSLLCKAKSFKNTIPESVIEVIETTFLLKPIPCDRETLTEKFIREKASMLLRSLALGASNDL